MNEVVATIMGLNGEGSFVADAFLVLFFSRFWEMVKTGLLPQWKNSEEGILARKELTDHTCVSYPNV